MRLRDLSASLASCHITQSGHTFFSRLAMAGYFNRISRHSALLSATQDAHSFNPAASASPASTLGSVFPFVGGMRRCSLLRCRDSVSVGCGREPWHAEPLCQDMYCIVCNKVLSQLYYWVLLPEPRRRHQRTNEMDWSSTSMRDDWESSE